MEWLLRLLGIDPVGKLLAALGDAYKAKLTAANDSDRIAAEVTVAQIRAQIDAVQASKEVKLATASFLEMRLLAFFTALPFVVHAGAVGMDTVFRFGWKIPAYPPPFDEWEGAILLGLLGIYTLGKGMSSIAAAIGRKR